MYSVKGVGKGEERAIRKDGTKPSVSTKPVQSNEKGGEKRWRGNTPENINIYFYRLIYCG